MPGVMFVETFEVIIGQLVFATANLRNTAEARIVSFLGNRPRFRDAEASIQRVAAGKYGAGPALLVTLQMQGRADADALWDDIEERAFGILQPVSIVWQSSVTFDAEEGTQTVTEIHRRTFPAAPDDF